MPQIWEHHHEGWTFVVKGIVDHFHNPYGVRFLDWADGFFRDQKPIDYRWCGILHNVIDYPQGNMDGVRILSLRDLVARDFFKQSLKLCRGLFTLTNHTRDFLRSNILGIQIDSLIYPSPLGKFFNWSEFAKNPQVVTIGQWMRKQESFGILKIKIPKKRLSFEWNKDLILDGVEIISYLNHQDYDDVLSKSIVFIDFEDVAACTVVLECIMRNTPVFVTNLPSNKEYLGDDYPGLFSSIDEACQLINNYTKMFNCHEYLTKLDKNRFSMNYFCKSIENSDVYKKLPILLM